MALRELEFTASLGELSERLVNPLKIELEVVSQRVREAIANIVEYPAGSYRHASSPYRWYVGEWLDYRFEKRFGKIGRNGQ